MKFTDEELNEILDELHDVDVDKLQGRSKDLFYAVMQIADQRDEYARALMEIREKLLCYGESFDIDIHKQFQKECLQIIDEVSGVNND